MMITVLRRLREEEMDVYACRYCEMRQAAEYVVQDDEGVTAICTDCLDVDTDLEEGGEK